MTACADLGHNSNDFSVKQKCLYNYHQVHQGVLLSLAQGCDFSLTLLRYAIRKPLRSRTLQVQRFIGKDISCENYTVPVTDKWNVNMEQWRNVTNRGKPTYFDRTCPSATMSATNPLWTAVGLSLCLRSK